MHGVSSTNSVPSVKVTIATYTHNQSNNTKKHLSIRIRDEGGGIAPADLDRVFSYAFTTAGRNIQDEIETEGGPYAAQQSSGSAAVDGTHATGAEGGNLFSELTGKGIQTGAGTLAGLGYGLPMSRLYARFVI